MMRSCFAVFYYTVTCSATMVPQHCSFIFLKDAGMFEVVKVEPIGFCQFDLQWWETCARPLRTEAGALAGEKPAAGEGLVSRDVLFLGQLASRMPRRAEI